MVEEFVCGDVDQAIGPGEGETGEEGAETPKVEGSAVEVGVSVRGDLVFVEVKMGLTTNNQPILVEV